MAVTPGSKALASEYNIVAELVNKIFGDKYSSASVTDPDRTNHKFGWGAINITDTLSSGTLITADRLQDLVERTNLIVDRINITDSILIFSAPTNRVNVLTNTPIRAEDLNVVESKLLNSVFANENHATIEVPGYADSILIEASTLGYIRSLPWANKLTGEHKWEFDDYNHARYFFNSGGTLGLTLSMTGGSTAGFYNWADIINEIGILTLNYNNTIQSSSITQGTSENKGFYNLTEFYGDGSDAGAPNEGLLFTSSGVTAPNFGYGYGYSGIFIHDGAFESAYPLGDSGYSGYSQRFVKVYGKHANNGSEVHFKIVLDDTAFSQVTDGTLSASLRYLMPHSVTNTTPGVSTPTIPYVIESDVQFDVTPAPTASVIDDFNTGDDS